MTRRKSTAAPKKPSPPRGRIITFYSYKGGTGRSMALANVAWILAANGQRVLAVDWDLEAPGLHRYFRPFLFDPELQGTAGLIDFFVDYLQAGRLQAAGALASQATPWFHDYTDLAGSAVALDHEMFESDSDDGPGREGEAVNRPAMFPGPGRLDFVCAGRQNASYPLKVNGFPWGEFYDKLGGAVFLEVVKARLRAEYDYILIDSRTGLSDTSGICTVQLPDDLVVCYTLNGQSIHGAAAAARSAESQRRLATGEPVLRIWPAPMRVELAERDRLEAARRLMRAQFDPMLQRMPKSERDRYWGKIEVLYFPYFAYDEILATIVDRLSQTNSLLFALENLTRCLTDGAVDSMPRHKDREREREALKALYEVESSESDGERIYLSLSRHDIDSESVRDLIKAVRVRNPSLSVYWDRGMRVEGMSGAREAAWDQAGTIVVFVGKSWLHSSETLADRKALAQLAGRQPRDKSIIPVVVGDVQIGELPAYLANFQAMHLRAASLIAHRDRLREEIEELADLIVRIAQRRKAKAPRIDPDDPQKGRWGGKSEQNGRQMSATVTAESENWFRIHITVSPTKESPLTGEVTFHLHDTFDPMKVTVPVKNGKAELVKHAFGAFTVGAVLDEGNTTLELDLATVKAAPARFRER